MKKLTVKGKYFMLALDQRGSFRRMLKTSTKKKIISVKKDILETIGKHSSAILLDPVYGKDLAKFVKKPLLFCMEKSGYEKYKGYCKTKLQPNWNVKKAKKLGADAIKLNLFYKPNAPEKILEHQKKIVLKIGKECKKNKIPFLLEILTYNCAKSTSIVKSVLEFKQTKYNVAVFKLEYPGNLKTCKKITKILSKIPWVLLSAGKPMKTFSSGLKIAMKGGCSGFLAGRAIWQKGLKTKKKREWFEKKGVKNIKELISIVRK
ncbi:tagatose 1,6-diphosphate aldolase [Candidatus Woesearchaeota archaeon]|nr:tagatose 1,6-diphosphate aldolase [Candidatus Woesearchaeota archaeon]